PSSPGAGDDGPNREEAPDIAPMTDEVVTLSGGRGLVSTLPDYFRFTELFRLKGEVDGARLLGRKTVDYMTRDHLINNLSGADRPAAPHIPPAGLGFGLGFFVMIDPARARVMGSPGDYASTGSTGVAFWTDPVEEMTVIFLSPAAPSGACSISGELRVLTCQAIID
ncbi:MAG: serine hydrolase, partial [Desulfobacterales bacterium]|nr:serine hydrolase [Desulfobacterales bacterium]